MEHEEPLTEERMTLPCPYCDGNWPCDKHPHLGAENGQLRARVKELEGEVSGRSIAHGKGIRAWLKECDRYEDENKRLKADLAHAVGCQRTIPVGEAGYCPKCQEIGKGMER